MSTNSLYNLARVTRDHLRKATFSDSRGLFFRIGANNYDQSLKNCIGHFLGGFKNMGLKARSYQVMTTTETPKWTIVYRGRSDRQSTGGGEQLNKAVNTNLPVEKTVIPETRRFENL